MKRLAGMTMLLLSLAVASAALAGDRFECMSADGKFVEMLRRSDAAKEQGDACKALEYMVTARDWGQVAQQKCEGDKLAEVNADMEKTQWELQELRSQCDFQK